MKKIIQKIKSKLDNSYEHFYILDLGNFSVKAALLEVDKNTNEGTILDITQSPYPIDLPKVGDKKTEELKGLVDVIKNLFADLKKPKNKSKTKKLIIGLSSELIGGSNYSNVYTREKPDHPVDEREVKNMIHNMLLRAYEDIRHKFTTESGYAETGVVLINPTIQKLQIDGKDTQDPIGDKGKEIFASLFSAYAPNFHKEVVDRLSKELGFATYELIYVPHAVFCALNKIKKDLHGLIVDMGGRSTRVVLAKKGKIENIKLFSFGGVSFTKRIAGAFEISDEEAESVKLRYINGDVSKQAKVFIDKLLQTELDLFLGGFELVLKDFSQAAFLPSDIYLYGGGGSITIMDAIIRKRDWKRDLIFPEKLKLHRVDVDYIKNVNFADNLKVGPQHVSIVALADYAQDTYQQQSNVVNKILHRTLNLVNE